MPEPLKAAALRGLGEPRGSFLVVDPGGRTGLALWSPVRLRGLGAKPMVRTCTLDELPNELNLAIRHADIDFVVCEDYHLAGGKAMQQSGSPMPSALGIGMCRVACEWTDTPLYLMQPNDKRAGHMALDAAGRAAYAAARNDHERDVVDIAGFVLREMRR